MNFFVCVEYVRKTNEQIEKKKGNERLNELVHIMFPSSRCNWSPKNCILLWKISRKKKIQRNKVNAKMAAIAVADAIIVYFLEFPNTQTQLKYSINIYINDVMLEYKVSIGGKMHVLHLQY